MRGDQPVVWAASWMVSASTPQPYHDRVKVLQAKPSSGRAILAFRDEAEGRKHLPALPPPALDVAGEGDLGRSPARVVGVAEHVAEEADVVDAHGPLHSWS